MRRRVGSTTTTLATGRLVPASISNGSTAAGGTQARSGCGSSTCPPRVSAPFLSTSSPVAAGALGVSVTPSGAIFGGDAGGVHRATL